MKYNNGNCPETDEQMYKVIDTKSSIKVSKKLVMDNKLLIQFNTLSHRYEISKRDLMAINPDSSMSVGEAEDIAYDYEYHMKKFSALLIKLWEYGFITIKRENDVK